MSSLGRVAMVFILGIGLLFPAVGCGRKQQETPPPPKPPFPVEDPHGFGQALWVAAGRCDLPTIRRLLKAGADVNIKLGPYLTTPLMECVQSPDHRCPSQTAVTLIQAGANMNTQDLRGYTVLHWVALHNCEPPQIELTRLLLQRGADPMIRDKRHFTAFDLAVEDNCSDKMGVIADYMARRLPKLKPDLKVPSVSEKPITPGTTKTTTAPSGQMATPTTTMMAPTTTMAAPPATLPPLPGPLESEKGMPGGYSTGSQWKKPGQ